jgi:hypothetical protein
MTAVVAPRVLRCALLAPAAVVAVVLAFAVALAPALAVVVLAVPAVVHLTLPSLSFGGTAVVSLALYLAVRRRSFQGISRLPSSRVWPHSDGSIE